MWVGKHSDRLSFRVSILTCVCTQHVDPLNTLFSFSFLLFLFFFIFCLFETGTWNLDVAKDCLELIFLLPLELQPPTLPKVFGLPLRLDLG